jgi:hypothetical protein
VQAVGVEGSGSYGAGLTRHQQAAGLTAVEANHPHAHLRSPRQERGHRRRGRRPQGAGQLVHHRALEHHRDGGGHPAAAPGGRPNGIRSIARRIRDLSEEIATLDHQLSTLVQQVAPRTLALRGIGVANAARLLVAAGENIDRLPSEAAFAHLCGVAPSPPPRARSNAPAQSRRQPRRQQRPTHDHRDQAAVCQRTRDYATRCTADGKSKKEIIRCLKRYIAREVYYTLWADPKDLTQAP